MTVLRDPPPRMRWLEVMESDAKTRVRLRRDEWIGLDPDGDETFEFVEPILRHTVETERLRVDQLRGLPSSGASSGDVYVDVVDAIIGALETAVLPWMRAQQVSHQRVTEGS